MVTIHILPGGKIARRPRGDRRRERRYLRAYAAAHRRYERFACEAQRDHGSARHIRAERAYHAAMREVARTFTRLVRA